MLKETIVFILILVFTKAKQSAVLLTWMWFVITFHSFIFLFLEQLHQSCVYRKIPFPDFMHFRMPIFF